MDKTRLDHERALEEALNSLLVQLKRFPMKKAILFGSVARGKVRASDMARQALEFVKKALGR